MDRQEARLAGQKLLRLIERKCEQTSISGALFGVAEMMDGFDRTRQAQRNGAWVTIEDEQQWDDLVMIHRAFSTPD